MIRALNNARAVQNCTFCAPIPLYPCLNDTPNNLEKRLNARLSKYIVINDHALQPIDDVQNAGVLTWH